MKPSPNLTRDAGAIRAFEPSDVEPRNGIDGVWVPMSFLRRAKRVAYAVDPDRRRRSVSEPEVTVEKALRGELGT